MQKCDFKTAITRAANIMDLDYEDGSYEINEKSDTIIDVLDAIFDQIDRQTIINSLTEATEELVEDSRINYMQDQDDASRRAEELELNPAKYDD